MLVAVVQVEVVVVEAVEDPVVWGLQYDQQVGVPDQQVGDMFAAVLTFGLVGTVALAVVVVVVEVDPVAKRLQGGWKFAAEAWMTGSLLAAVWAFVQD